MLFLSFQGLFSKAPEKGSNSVSSTMMPLACASRTTCLTLRKNWPLFSVGVTSDHLSRFHFLRELFHLKGASDSYGVNSRLLGVPGAPVGCEPGLWLSASHTLILLRLFFWSSVKNVSWFFQVQKLAASSASV